MLHVPLRAPCVPGRARSAQRTLRARHARSRPSAAAPPVRSTAIVTAPVQKSSHQRRRHPIFGAHRIPRAPHGAAAAGDDAGRRRHARRARDDAPAAAQGQRARSRPSGSTRCCASCTTRPATRCSAFAGRASSCCGLNPHAGESGHLGREEIEVHRSRSLAALRRRGMSLDRTGARRHGLPARRVCSGCDAVLAMYHDQGLPVLKHASFGHAVNVTLGLPIVRTSVDHGTALDLAGTRKADAGSLHAAIDAGARSEPARRTGHALVRPARQEALRSALPARPGHDRAHRARHRRRSRASGSSRSARAGAPSRAPLLEQAGTLDVIEIDRDVLPLLETRCARPRRPARAPRRCAGRSTLATLRGAGPRLRLVGNLPYNISTPLLFRLHRAARRDRGHALHAAEGSRRAHGGGARAAPTTVA